MEVSAPVVICARGLDDSRSIETVTLAWNRDQRWVQRVVDRREIADQRLIVGLAAFGLPVTTSNSRMLVEYLDRFESANRHCLPIIRFSPKMGWQGVDGVDGFLCGRILITQAGIHVSDNSALSADVSLVKFRGADTGDDQLADGYYQSGSLNNWLNAIKPLSAMPRAMVAFYAAFVPAMLPIIRASNFVIDFAGETSGGKTTMLCVAASCWGSPRLNASGAPAAMSTWNSTAVWRERAPAVCNNMPLILDETQNFRNPEEIRKTIYGVVQGRSRGRGTVSGLARSETCQTVLLSSGEQPLTSFTKDAGTRPRVLSFWGSPFGAKNEQSRQQAESLDSTIGDNFGHAGPLFVKFLQNRRHRWGIYRKRFDELRAFYAKKAGDNVIAGRMANSFAAIHTTALLVHLSLGKPWAFRVPIEPVWDELIGTTGEADIALRALRYTAEWAVAHRAEFYGLGMSDSKAPSRGWVGRWDGEQVCSSPKSRAASWIGFIPHCLREVLVAEGFEYESITRSWKQRGWLITDDVKHNTKKAQIAHATTRLIAIRRSEIEKINRIDVVEAVRQESHCDSDEPGPYDCEPDLDLTHDPYDPCPYDCEPDLDLTHDPYDPCPYDRVHCVSH